MWVYKATLHAEAVRPNVTKWLLFCCTPQHEFSVQLFAGVVSFTVFPASVVFSTFASRPQLLISEHIRSPPPRPFPRCSSPRQRSALVPGTHFSPLCIATYLQHSESRCFCWNHCLNLHEAVFSYLSSSHATKLHTVSWCTFFCTDKISERTNNFKLCAMQNIDFCI